MAISIKDISWRCLHEAGRLLQGYGIYRKRKLAGFLKVTNEERMYKALSHFLARDFQPDEKELLAKIESRREEMNSSDAPLARMDYGTGVWNSTRPAEGAVTYTTVGRLCRHSSKSPKLASLLFFIIRAYQPQTCLELGTCLGVSAGYQAAALFLNNKGKLHTMEGAPASAEIARRNLADWKLGHIVTIITGSFQSRLPQALENIGQLDYVFIDGHHDGQATTQYFNQIAPYLSKEAIVIFDDINRSAGMYAAWNHLKRHSGFILTIDIGTIGIALTARSTAFKGHFRL